VSRITAKDVAAPQVQDLPIFHANIHSGPWTLQAALTFGRDELAPDNAPPPRISADEED
jgi:hypothetical protein